MFAKKNKLALDLPHIFSGKYSYLKKGKNFIQSNQCNATTNNSVRSDYHVAC
jgi:hypothetical protein